MFLQIFIGLAVWYKFRLRITWMNESSILTSCFPGPEPIDSWLDIALFSCKSFVDIVNIFQEMMVICQNLWLFWTSFNCCKGQIWALAGGLMLFHRSQAHGLLVCGWYLYLQQNAALYWSGELSALDTDRLKNQATVWLFQSVFFFFNFLLYYYDRKINK